MPLMGPAGRRGRRRGLIVGAAVGSAAARRNAAGQQSDQPAQADQTNTSDGLAEIEQLNKLKEQGILTQEEFDAKKKQILGI